MKWNKDSGTEKAARHNGKQMIVSNTNQIKYGSRNGKKKVKPNQKNGADIGEHQWPVDQCCFFIRATGLLAEYDWWSPFRIRQPENGLNKSN